MRVVQQRARLPCWRHVGPFSCSRWPRSSQATPSTTEAAATSGKQRQILVSHVLVPAPKAQVLDECERQLAAGTATFAALAQQHSDCKSSKSQGGQLGWLDQGTYFPSFEAVAFSTPVGQRARAITPRGHHLLLVSQERLVYDMQQMSVHELAELLTNPALLEEVQLVDVREPWEVQMACLPGFKVYPLSGFEEWNQRIVQELDPAAQTVVMCHHGMRSMNVATWLLQHAGFTDVHNVVGGIDAYARGVDSRVPLY